MAAAPRLRLAWILDVWDGVQTGGVVSARRFVEALRERHEVTVVATGAPGEGRVALPAFYPPLVGRIMREMGFVFAVPRRRAIEEVLRRVDVVHVQFPFWLGVRAVRLARRAGVPVVAGFHVQPENLFRNVGLSSRMLSEWTYRLFLRTFYDRADAVVCPTEFAREELRRRGLRAPAEVISNGVAPQFRPFDAERPERHRGRFLLLAVGRLAREKRLDVVIEGVRRSRHADRIQLVITGRGPEAERVRRLGAALPVPAEVTFLDDGELVRLLSTADLLLHASEVELEGIAVLEALGCGTPALVADAPLSAARSLALGEGLRFRPGDPADLARRLDALLDDPAKLSALRARAAAAGAAQSIAASVDRLDALYQRLAAATATRRAAAAAPGGGSRATREAR